MLDPGARNESRHPMVVRQASRKGAQPMRVAVVNETSAVDKHPFIMSALEGRGLDVVNAGMAAPGEEPELQYVHTGFISALLLAAGRVDMVVGGCGTGQGYMNSVVQYPGVFCGHLLTSLDAFLFARINAGNVISLALNQGWGWAGDENLRLLFDQLFTSAKGEGFPAHRQEPQRASREKLEIISDATHRSMAEIVVRLPDDIVVPALRHPAVSAVLDTDSIDDLVLRSALQARLLKESLV
jgi:ribose 5-phosphate isomerase RpiB